MGFMCQKSALCELSTLAKDEKRSILIEGPEGSGKTYLAKQYASLLEVDDFQIVAPKVDEIKQAILECTRLSSSIVICIENLDCGLVAASYSLLKFLEEPSSNVFIVVTCRNLKHVPDTIISRSSVVVTSPPVDSDISTYASDRDFERYNKLRNTRIWSCVRTFNDADIVLKMNSDQLAYFDSLIKVAQFKDTVSNLVWNIGHYPDNKETPVELVIRYIMSLVGTKHIQTSGIECIRDLSQKRIATHAVLAKFVFEAKYCE